MSSLRLALKQSLEETSATTPPPPAPAVQGLPLVDRNSPHHAALVTAGAVATPGAGSGSVTSYHTEEDSTSPVPKKRGPGRPRKYPRAPGEQPRKRGRPRKHPAAGGDEDAFSSENEFSVGEEGPETEHSHEDVHDRTSAASKIQSHWKKSKGKPSLLEGSAVAEPPGAMAGGPKTETQQSREDDPLAPPASSANQSKPVTPPSQELVEWMRSMSQKRARKAVSPGLRVKVRFVTNNKVKKDGKVTRKRIWYGGRVTAVSKEGSKIKIKYDDKTSEVTQFPDKDVVIDDYLNGKHQAKADKFIPPDINAEDADDEDLFGDGLDAEEEQHHVTKPTRTKETTTEETKPKPEPTTTSSSSKVLSMEIAQPKLFAKPEPVADNTKTEGSVKSITKSFSEMSTMPSHLKGHSDIQPKEDANFQPEKPSENESKAAPEEVGPTIETREASLPLEASKHAAPTKLPVEEKVSTLRETCENPSETSFDTIGQVAHPAESLAERPSKISEPAPTPDLKESGKPVEATCQSDKSHPTLGKEAALGLTSEGDTGEPLSIDDPAESTNKGSPSPEHLTDHENATQPMEIAAQGKAIGQPSDRPSRDVLASDVSLPETAQERTAETKTIVPTEEAAQTVAPKASISVTASDGQLALERPVRDIPKETQTADEPKGWEAADGAAVADTEPSGAVGSETTNEVGEVSEPGKSEADAPKGSAAIETPDGGVAESKLEEPNGDPGPKPELPAKEVATAQTADLPEPNTGKNLTPSSAPEIEPAGEELAEEPAKPKRKRGRPPKHRPPVDLQGKSGSNDSSHVPSEPAARASSMESGVSLDTSEKSDSKDGNPTCADASGGDTKAAAKPSLTIRITNLKKASLKNDEKETSEETGSPRGKKRTSSTLEGEEPPAKRIHIHIGSKGSQENLSDHTDQAEKTAGGSKPPKGADASLPRDGTLSPRPKKAKRKREREIDSTPRIASKPGKKNADKTDAAPEGPKADQASPDDVGEHKISGSGDDEALTPDMRIKGDNQSAARSGRRAAQQANERISSKNDLPPDQANKKRKKKRREMEEGEAGRDEEIPAFQWVQCDKCAKWRIIPSSVVEALPPMWYCADNKWDSKRASCDAPEQTPKQVAKERRRKKRKLMMEREAAEAAEQAVATGAAPAEASTSPRNSDEAAEAQRASPSEHSLESGHGVEVSKEKKSTTSSKKPKNASVVDVPPIVEEEPKPRGRGRPRRNPPKEASTPSAPSNSIPPANDEADNLEWVQCEKCDKWRKLPPHISADELPDVWYCSMNTWNPVSASCSAPEDKADGLQDIFNNNATSGKLSYRNLIFGSNGRKHNRPVSERTRAAESLFAAVSDDSDAPPAVTYANSSAFICRGKMNNQDENDRPTVLDLMSQSHLWTQLQKSQPKSAVPLLFDALSTQARESMKDIVLHCLGDQTLTGEQLHAQVRDRNWENAPLGWAAVRKYCTENMLVMTMCELVKMGVLECFRVDGPFPNGQLWTLCYRRANAQPAAPSPSGAAATPEESDLPDMSSRRCMKFAKPWKRAHVAS